MDTKEGIGLVEKGLLALGGRPPVPDPVVLHTTDHAGEWTAWIGGAALAVLAVVAAVMGYTTKRDMNAHDAGR